jgi:hypothetical protein
MSDLRFERDVLPLFRSEDVEAMSFAFDLSSYEDVCENAEEMHSRLCRRHDALRCTLAEEDVGRVRRWIDAGMAA